MPRDGHAADLEGGGDDAVAEGQVVADHLDPEQHLFQVPERGILEGCLGKCARGEGAQSFGSQIIGIRETTWMLPKDTLSKKVGRADPYESPFQQRRGKRVIG